MAVQANATSQEYPPSSPTRQPAHAKQKLREERSRPVMEAMRRWLDDALPRIPEKTLTGKALAYLDGQWPKLLRVLNDGRSPLDTNGVENSIRPFVVGRKNWLFADTVRGAQANANLYSLIEIYSLIETANWIEPFAYLCGVWSQFERE